MKTAINRLFNNRAFVAVLALGSVLLLARSVVAPFLDRPDLSSVPVPVDFPEEGVAAAGREPAGGAARTFRTPTAIPRAGGEADGSAAVNIGGLSWRAAPQRDPFSPRAGAEAAGARPALDPGEPQTPALPTLDALVAGPESLLAVLDDRIVREGDELRGYRVVRISLDGVRVRSARGSLWLTVDGGDHAAGGAEEQASGQQQTRRIR